MRRIPRRRLQNRQVLGYNFELGLHFLVLPARSQSIEEQGEDFLCIPAKDSATNSRNCSSRYPFANLIRLPSQLNCPARFSLRYLERKQTSPSHQEPHFFFPSSRSS